MGLIIHPSSCCDVCLEVFTYDEPKPPHAIPCGHIFCKDCLHTVNPRNCPLCRKAFIPERSKKLITGELASSEGVDEVHLLKRLVISWDLQEEQLVEVTTEVETWLRGREENPTNLPLWKAWEALRAFHKLKTQSHDDRRTIRRLKQEIRLAIDEKNTANGVGQSLIAQVEEFHTKVSQYETEIQKLREELAKFKYTKNPLPAPPEPAYLDQVPALSHSTATGSRSFPWPPTDSVNGSDETVYHNFLSEGEDSHDHSREAQRVRDRKGKRRAREGRERLPPGIYRTPELISPSNGTENGTTTTIINGNRNAFIPGATPNQRVMPMRETAFEDLNAQTAAGYVTPPKLRDQLPIPLDPSQFVDPYILTAEFVSGYPDGYAAGYQAALNPSIGEGDYPNSYSTWGTAQSSSLDPPLGSHNRSSRKHHPHPRWIAEEDHAEYPADSYRSVAPLSAPSHTNSRPAQDTVDEHTRSQRIPSPLSAPIPTTIIPRSGIEAQLLGWEDPSRSISQYIQSSSTMPPQRTETVHENGRPRNHRRRTVPVDGYVAEPEVDTTDQSVVRMSQLRRRSAIIARRSDVAPTNGTAVMIVDNRSSLIHTNTRSSVSSWGTVDSENPPISVSDLPIHTDFSLGARGSIHLSPNLHDAPLNGIGGPANGEGSVVGTTGITTPRARGASFTMPVSTASPVSTSSQGTERPRDRRVASTFSAQPPMTDTTLSYRGGASDYVPFGRLSVSTPESSEHDSNSAGSTQWNDAGHVTDNPSSLAGNALGLHLSRLPDNALGLQLNQSPQISAPTPIVPSRTFLRSFSHDSYY